MKRQFFLNVGVENKSGGFDYKSFVVIAESVSEAIVKFFAIYKFEGYSYPVSVVDGLSGRQYLDNLL